MPNWCYNNMTLSNENKEKIDELVSKLEKDSDKLFEYLRPNPSGEWEYDWSVDNWGTKWDARISNWQRDDDNTISFSFDTAWSPPIKFYQFLTNEEWFVSASYHEEGMGFVGEFEDGEDFYYEYDITDRDSLDGIPEHIIENWNLEQIFDDYEDMNLEEEEC